MHCAPLDPKSRPHLDRICKENRPRSTEKKSFNARASVCSVRYPISDWICQCRQMGSSPTENDVKELCHSQYTLRNVCRLWCDSKGQLKRHAVVCQMRPGSLLSFLPFFFCRRWVECLSSSRLKEHTSAAFSNCNRCRNFGLHGHPFHRKRKLMKINESSVKCVERWGCQTHLRPLPVFAKTRPVYLCDYKITAARYPPVQ